MDIDKDAVQDFVDAAVAWYEKESIFCNGVTVRTDDSHKVPLNECREKGETDADSLNMGTALMPVKRKITRITNCEERKIINSFDGEAGSSKSISPREFAKELSNLSKSRFSHKNRVLLPDVPEYEEALRQGFGTTDRVGGDDGHPAYYFDHRLSPDTGFVVSNHIYVIQSSQGSEYRLLSDDLSAGELAADNSGNRLKMHIGNKGYSPIDVALWTKFTDPQDIRSGDLLELDLPDPDKVL